MAKINKFYNQQKTKKMRTRWITWLITATAVINQLYAILAENSGLLVEIGVPANVTKVILTLGVLWTAFSKSLVPKSQSIIGGSTPPSNKDEK